MRAFINVLVLMALFSFATAQDFGRLSTPIDEEQADQKEKRVQTPPIGTQVLALENAIDPDTYVLGPGDEIGLSIQTEQIFTYPLTVTPTGDLFIPSVGVCHVSGLSFSAAKIKVKRFVNENAFPQAKSYMVLINPRTFKLQVSGAVKKPGFVVLTPTTRLQEVIELSEGFQALAKEYEIEVKRSDNSSYQVNFHNFLLQGNLDDNPTFIEGDKVHVPYAEISENGIVKRGAIENPGYDIIAPGELLGDYIKRQISFNDDIELERIVINRVDLNTRKNLIVPPEQFSTTILKPGDILNFEQERGISVIGFVQSPGGFAFFPGYSAEDYIALAGGNSIEGSAKSAIIRHLDGSEESAHRLTLKRGDVIIVPRTYKDILFGNVGVVAGAVSLTSLILTFIAATK